MLKFSNKIIYGDCLKELKKIPDKTFDLVFADPPYNMQIGEKLTRPDSSKVNGVNDKWDQFNSFKHYDEFCESLPPNRMNGTIKSNPMLLGASKLLLLMEVDSAMAY